MVKLEYKWAGEFSLEGTIKGYNGREAKYTKISSSMGALFSGEPFKIGLSAENLIKILKTIKSDEAVFGFEGADKVVEILPLGQDEFMEYRAYLMPIMLGAT